MYMSIPFAVVREIRLGRSLSLC